MILYPTRPIRKQYLGTRLFAHKLSFSHFFRKKVLYFGYSIKFAYINSIMEMSAGEKDLMDFIVSNRSKNTTKRQFQK